MSFTRLLAASRSLIGIKKQPGPYKLNQEHLLPKFAPMQRPAAAADEDGGSAAAEKRPVQETAGGIRRSRERAPRLLRSLAERMTRWRRPVPSRMAARPVQTELSLNGIKVVRNDLSDCNFQVVLGGDGERTTGKEGRPGSRQGLGMVWNRLSARLLRQAAQEFTLVQKERGKLCSQAGNGSAGPGGP